ncbi:MAG: DM13 domain-containing protein [Nitrososphaerales archaeon]
MMTRTKIIIGVIIAIIVVPLAVYTVSPLFVSTEVNEPLPVLASAEFQRFMNLTEDGRIQAADNMSKQEKDSIMITAAKENSTVNESMDANVARQEAALFQNKLSGNFIGVNDGIHNAEGVAKVIVLDDGTNVLRFENFKATNGPDLYVYLATDRSASDIINLGRLKGNIGNQNYPIPAGTDLAKYNTVLIWCKAFSVLFGSAQLASPSPPQ